jgi:hypothetical protein
MGELHVLTICLFIQDLCARFFDFQFSVVVELLDHISIHLNVVSFRFDLSHFLLQQLQVALQFRSNHLHELVIGLLLFLGFLGGGRQGSILIIFNFFEGEVIFKIWVSGIVVRAVVAIAGERAQDDVLYY